MRNTIKASLLAVMIVVVFLGFAPAFASNPPTRNDFPRMDEVIHVFTGTEATTMTKATAQLIDTAWDVRKASNVQILQDAGWKVSAVLGYGFHTLVMQCRSVMPDWSNAEYDYHGRRPGDPSFPMNISAFRFALHLIIGGEVKQTIINQVFGWTSIALDTIPNIATGSAWINPTIASQHNEPLALSVLNQAGFYNTTAQTGLANGIWANTNATIGPIGEIRGTAGFLGTYFEKNIVCLTNVDAVSSTSLVTVKFMNEWNRFFGLNSNGQPYFKEDSINGNDFWLVVDDCDMDMEGMGWVVGKDPDYLYDFFHSDGDVYGGYNIEGIHDSDIDRLTAELKFTAWPNGTIITDIAALQAICKEAQYYIYYLCPYLVNRAALTPCAYAYAVSGMNKVHDWIEPLGYTSETGWTYDYVTVDTTNVGPSIVRACNPGVHTTFNPLKATTVYDWNVLSRLFDGFITIDPFTKLDANWAASSTSIVEWTDAGLNAHGLNLTFTIRHGITWHNGDPFNSTDAKWSLDFICNLKPGRYINLWSNMYNATDYYKGDAYKLNVLFNNTGLWYKYDVAGDAMMFNRKVWQSWWGGNVTEAQLWAPDGVNYDTKTGETGHGALTCLIGTAEWVYVTYNAPGLYGIEMANRPFVLTDPAWTYTGHYWAPFLREDNDISGKVDMQDMYRVQQAYGSVPGNPRWDYGRLDIVQNWKVDMIDLYTTQKNFGKITLPP